jgi:cytochrome c oxidase subunit 5b
MIVLVVLTFSLSDDHGHGHHHPPHVEPKTFADYVKPDYWYR